MTRWIIQLNANSREDDSKVMKIMQAAARSGLQYTVRSSEIEVKPSSERYEPRIVK